MVLSEQAINATSRFPETPQLNRDFRYHLGDEIVARLSFYPQVLYRTKRLFYTQT